MIKGDSGHVIHRNDQDFLDLKKTIEEIKLVLRCGICYSTINDGILTTCNHAFCKKCHTQCFNTVKNLRCPICNQLVNKRSCQPCPSLSTVTKQYIHLAKCFKLDCASLSVPKEMQFLESQAICDSQFAPFDNSLPTTSAAQPVFLIPQLAPKAKRQRLLKNTTRTHIPKLSESSLRRRKLSKSQVRLETIAEANESGSASTRNDEMLDILRLEDNAPAPPKIFVNSFSQCVEMDWAEELRIKVLECLRAGEAKTPLDALIHCLPWIPEYIGLDAEVIRDAIEKKQNLLENMYISVGVQANIEIKDPVSRVEKSTLICETSVHIPNAAEEGYVTQRRDSFIDVVGMSDKGEDDVDSDATVPMFIDERGRLSDIDNIEQHSNKENNEPLIVENMKDCRVDDDEDYCDSNSRVEGNCSDVAEEGLLVNDVVTDSLDSFPVDNSDTSGKSGIHDDKEELILKKPTATVEYVYKIIVSGGIQSDDLSLLKGFFEIFSCATLWKDFDEHCTHLVILNSEGRLCKKRSLKYAWAIARSIPVLCKNWLLDSFVKRKIMKIEDYEIVGDVCCDPKSNSSLRSRSSPCSLFSGFFLCFPSAYFKESDIDRGLLINMTEAAGGNCSAKIWDAHYMKDAKKSFIVFGIGCCNREAAKKFEEDLKVQVITAEWILDCLTQFTIFDTSVYRILEM